MMLTSPNNRWEDAYSDRNKKISDLNKEKRAKLERDIGESFSRWVEGGSKEDFDREYIVNSLSTDAKSGLSNSLNNGPLLAQLLLSLGIDPEAVIGLIGLRGRFEDSIIKDLICSAIKTVAEEIGESNLNVNYVDGTHRGKEVIVPDSLRRQIGPFPLSEKHDHIATMRLGSFHKRCVTIFSSWDLALKASGFDPQEIKRKIASLDHMEIIRDLDDFDRDRDGVWSFAELRNSAETSPLSRALYNNTGQNNESMPFSGKMNGMRVPIANLLHFRDTGLLAEDMEWFESNNKRIEEEYRKHHFQKIHPDEIQMMALKRYSEGKGFSRGVTDDEGKTLISACRNHDKGGDHRNTLARNGILTDRIDNLERWFEDIGTNPHENPAVKKMRELVGNAVENQLPDYMLSREYVKQNHPDCLNKLSNFAKALSHGVRWRSKLGKNSIDWSETLRAFGLDPSFFELSQKKRAKRGIDFQRFILSCISEVMTEVHSPQEVLSANQFCYNKRLGCEHHVNCQPDFYLQNSIIDAKVGGSLARMDQLKRYLDHREVVVIVTLNDAEKEKSLSNGTVRIISFDTFVKQSEEIIGAKLDPRLPQKLTEYLRNRANGGQED